MITQFESNKAHWADAFILLNKRFNGILITVPLDSGNIQYAWDTQENIITNSLRNLANDMAIVYDMMSIDDDAFKEFAEACPDEATDFVSKYHEIGKLLMEIKFDLLGLPIITMETLSKFWRVFHDLLHDLLI